VENSNDVFMFCLRLYFYVCYYSKLFLSHLPRTLLGQMHTMMDQNWPWKKSILTQFLVFSSPLKWFFNSNYVLYIFYNIFKNTFNENTWIKFKHTILKSTLFKYVILTFQKSTQMPTFIYNNILNKNFIHFDHKTCDKVPLYK
jgi:hypothetical protein